MKRYCLDEDDSGIVEKLTSVQNNWRLMSARAPIDEGDVFRVHANVQQPIYMPAQGCKRCYTIPNWFYVA